MAAVARGTDAAVTLARGADDAAKYQTKLRGISDIFASNDDLFKQTMDSTKFVDNLNQVDPNDLKEVLKGVNDTNRLADIGKKLDKNTLDALKKVDGGADLVKKLDPSSAKKLSSVQRAKNAATAFSKAFSAKLSKATKSIRKYISGAPNQPKTLAGATEAAVDSSKKLPPGKTLDNASNADVSKGLVETVGGNADEAAEAVENTANVLKDGSEASKSLRKSLAELGITPGSVAIGAGVIVLLCMAYDTDNPFTAVDRALDDTGKVVKGFKEVADSAATAVKNTAEGGFDFISFVTQNSWISFACSILCVILLFALFMTGMIGSMGGNNKR
tara:strand:+ start:5759 stop:6751 length:993 start_codon:yes stop_codon:yes gene_type:complete